MHTTEANASQSTIIDFDAWALARLLADVAVDGELGAVSAGLRPVVDHLAAVAAGDRQAIFEGYMLGRSNSEAIIKAIADSDPRGPAPPIGTPRQFASCADLDSLGSLPWVWQGWLPSSRVVGIAALEGVGKTRLALDLARRVWHGESWPDGQAMTLPPRSPTIWVAADGQQDELAATLTDLAMPPEAILFPTPPDDPYGGTSLDDKEIWVALGEACVIHKPAFVVVDSLSYATRFDICEQSTIARLKTPLVTLAQTHQVVVMLLLHVSTAGVALGHRIRGVTRTLLHLDCPDPTKPERLKLWIEKSFAKRPAPLGVTIGQSGNTYDSKPPIAPEPRRPGRPPEERDKAKQFIRDELTKDNDQIANELVVKWDRDHRGASKTFWRAVDDLEDAGELVKDGGTGTGKQTVLHILGQNPDP